MYVPSRTAALICAAVAATGILSGCASKAPTPAARLTTVSDNQAQKPASPPAAAAQAGLSPVNTATKAADSGGAPLTVPTASGSGGRSTSTAGSTSSGSGPASSEDQSVGSAGSDAASTELSRHTDSKIGDVVEDRDGKVLYRYDRDSAKPSQSRCDKKCEQQWEPVIVIITVTVINVRGLNSKLLGVLHRSDGRLQLTINGWPMYRYRGDHKAHDTYGQDKDGLWWAVRPDGGKNMMRMHHEPPAAKPSPTYNNGGVAAPPHW